MPVSEEEANELAKSRWKEEPEEVYGPHKFGGLYVWEFWIDFGDDKSSLWGVTFIVEHTSSYQYFDTVQALILFLSETYQAATLEAGAMDWTRTKELADLERKKITLYIAAGVFSITVVTMLSIIAIGQFTEIYRGTQNYNIVTLIVTTVLGVIASGAVLFFGQWIPIGGKGGVTEVDRKQPAVRVQQRSARSNPRDRQRM